MTADNFMDRRSPLLDQLGWFIRLRWAAGVLMIAGAAIDAQWLQEYHDAVRLTLIGVMVLAYNAVLLGVLPALRRRPRGSIAIVAFAWLQLVLDLGCLTLVTLWTGGLRSPVLGFFVFHMVFASLLLPRVVAYASATAAVAMMALGLRSVGYGPWLQADVLVFLGWAVTLLFTVHLCNHITRRLRQQRRRLLRQNRRIRRMSWRLERQQQALVQQEKMAAMGQLAAGVAHEIANPLAGIDSLLQLMQRHPDRPRPEAIETLRSQTERIGTILRQMNSFAHPVDTQWQHMTVNDVVEQTLSVMRFDKRMKDVVVEKRLAADVGQVRLQPQAMQQVLVNLMVNALDAMEKTMGPQITISTSRRVGRVVVEVADNGPGIDAKCLTRVFEPFFTTKPVGKGTGLGLSISYTLVESQGGKLEVRNGVDGGAVFTISLPAGSEVSLPVTAAGRQGERG